MNKKLFISAAALSVSLTVMGMMPLLAGAQTAPSVTSISPTSAVAGSSDTTLLIYGTNFVSGSAVEFNGLPLSATYISPTELSATIPASDLSAATSDAVYVSNPGGMTSGLQNSLLFTVTPTTATMTPGLPNTGFNPGNGARLNVAALLEAVSAAALLFLGIKSKKLFS